MLVGMQERSWSRHTCVSGGSSEKSADHLRYAFADSVAAYTEALCPGPALAPTVSKNWGLPRAC